MGYPSSETIKDSNEIIIRKGRGSGYLWRGVGFWEASSAWLTREMAPIIC